MRSPEEIKAELKELSEPLIPPHIPSGGAGRWMENQESNRSKRRQEIQLELLLDINDRMRDLAKEI